MLRRCYESPVHFRIEYLAERLQSCDERFGQLIRTRIERDDTLGGEDAENDGIRRRIESDRTLAEEKTPA